MALVKQKRKHQLKLSPTLQVLAAVGLFMISIVLVRDDKMAGWEKAIFSAVYDLPAGLTPFFLAVTQMGSVWVLFGLSLLYLLRQKHNVVVRLMMSGLSAYLVSGVCKDLFGRGRPIEFITDLILRDYSRGPGFPSGHMAMATAIALTINYYLPRRYKWVVPGIIIGVGVSRVYLGVHAPIDIFGGLAIGWGCAAIFRTVEIREKWHKKSPSNTKAAKRSRALQVS